MNRGNNTTVLLEPTESEYMCSFCSLDNARQYVCHISNLEHLPDYEASLNSFAEPSHGLLFSNCTFEPRIEKN
uniref:Uncharacterized protein n=1 Tax=Arundo donax TaxID=35708 RepID=A0A0A9BDJ5_ARUDO